MRYSMQRETIYKILLETKSHPNADWVYDKARQVLPNLSLGTVYRNLNQLAAEGLVATVETEKKQLHFDGDVSEHTHFVCEECDKIYDIEAKSNFAEISAKLGYKLKCEKVVLYGVCKECNNKKN